ncbi:hypothetical protein [Caulobacter sp. Root655]|uniref:DUF2987 domain-containing protein n=1 Tax=Caulobacter sp. Root655 TaxID=1736578 RepID=UPI0009E8983A|nr:hypothetical protein [Caulobacter sp. Root655]
MTLSRHAAAPALIALALASATLTSGVFATAAWADTGKTVPATKVFPFLEAFLKVPANERSRMRVSYSLRQGGKPPAGVKATLIEAGGARTPLPIDAAGRFERTPTLAQLQAKAQVTLDAPPETKFGIAMDLDPTLKPAMEYETRDLVATVTETNAAIRKAAGPMAMIAPTMTGIAFAKAESGVAVFPNGASQPLPVVEGMPYYRPEQFKGAVKVRLGRMPASVGFYDKKK